MTSPPPPPLFAVSPAAANLPDLTILGFLKSSDAFPLYLLISLILYIVQLRYCRVKHKPKPLKKEILKSLPKLKLSQERVVTVRVCSCVICLENYVAGDVVRVLPQCGHEFHAVCIDKWFQSGSTCPSCRSVPVVHHQTNNSSPLLHVLMQE